MTLPKEPVTLTPAQVAELNKKLADLRHNVNNNLSLIIAGFEIIQRKPEAAEKVWKGLAEQPRKIADLFVQFSHELESALNIKQ